MTYATLGNLFKLQMQLGCTKKIHMEFGYPDSELFFTGSKHPHCEIKHFQNYWNPTICEISP